MPHEDRVSFNQVVILGKINTLPQLRAEQGRQKICSSTLWLTTTKPSREFEKRQSTTVVPIVAFGRVAEDLSRLIVGEMLLVSGHFSSAGGQLEVVCDRVAFVETVDPVLG